MGFLTTAAEWLGLTRADKPSPGATPPSRSEGGVVTADQALTISTVFRAIQIHAVAAMQLSIDVDRRDETIPTPSLASQPDVNESRSAFVERTVVSLATTGNAFWRKTYSDSTGAVTNLAVLNPHEVTVVRTLNDQVEYHHKNRRLTSREVSHLQFLRVPGRVAGLGPIQAAQVELSGAIDLRDYAGSWFRTAGVPNGVLRTDQHLNPEQAAQYKEMWNAVDAGGTRILGAGLAYEPIMLKPADAQWLENQQFTVTQIARLFGIPASLLLATVEGGSQSYANVEQDWLAYTRFSLMAYLREIEDALSAVLPRGQTARFNIEALLRTDTKTRYESYDLAITSGWMLRSEVRSIEKLPALEGIDDVRSA